MRPRSLQLQRARVELGDALFRLQELRLAWSGLPAEERPPLHEQERAIFVDLEAAAMVLGGLILTQSDRGELKARRARRAAE